MHIPLKYESGSVKITEDQALQFLTKEEIAKGEKRFDTKTVGPWHECRSIKGLAATHNFETGEFVVVGFKTLSKPKSLGYEMEGKVSYEGAKVRAFTSSQLFELPNGDLVNVAILHVCA